MKPRLASSLLAFAVLAGVGLVAWAQTAQSVDVGYQGHLERGGQPYSGQVDLTFRLFDAPQAGSQLGGETLRTVSVNKGAFTTTLTLDPDAFVDGDVFVEVEVDGVTLAGRQQLRPVPYAAGTANSHPFLSSGPIVLENQPAEEAVIDVATVEGGTALELRPSAQTHLRVVAADVELCNDDRLGGDCEAVRRRALVHGLGDVLSLNYNQDYAGGTTVMGPLSTGCRPEWTPVSDGRLCISNDIAGPDNMYDVNFENSTEGAIANCRNRMPASHVCLEHEVQQACGAGFDYFGENDSGFNPNPNSFWYGNVLGDNSYMWNNRLLCGHPDINVGAANALDGIAYWRCCY